MCVPFPAQYQEQTNLPQPSRYATTPGQPIFADGAAPAPDYNITLPANDAGLPAVDDVIDRQYYQLYLDTFY